MLFGCLTMIIMFVLTLLIAPILSFFGGYLTGLILEWFVGDMITNGLNLLFNTVRFNADKLPIICGALAVVGSFFRNSLTVNKKD